MCTLSDFRLLSLLFQRTLSGRVWSIISLRDVTLKRHSAVRDPLYSFLQQSNLLESTKTTVSEINLFCDYGICSFSKSNWDIFQVFYRWRLNFCLTINNTLACKFWKLLLQSLDISMYQPWPVFGALWSSGLSPPAQHQTRPVGVSWPADPFEAPTDHSICSLICKTLIQKEAICWLHNI